MKYSGIAEKIAKIKTYIYVNNDGISSTSIEVPKSVSLSTYFWSTHTLSTLWLSIQRVSVRPMIGFADYRDACLVASKWPPNRVSQTTIRSSQQATQR